MRVRIKKITEGPGPSEAIVAIRTTSNDDEELVVHANQIKGDSLEVFPPAAEIHSWMDKRASETSQQIAISSAS
jgi:hypothetical protein